MALASVDHPLGPLIFFDGSSLVVGGVVVKKGNPSGQRRDKETDQPVASLQFGNIAQRQHRLMLFQQGFPIGSSHFPTAHDTIIASNLFPETSLEIPDLQSSWNDLAVHDKDHTVRQRRKQPPPAIATQAIAGLFATGPPINPRVWSVQKYELAQSHIADGSVCSTPPLTASIGSLPESLASNSCQTPFSPSGPSSRDVFVKLSGANIYTSGLPNRGSTSTASRTRQGDDYGQMFSPRNNMGYLSSLQGNQSCQQRNTEIAESFSDLRDQFYSIVREWPQKDGMYLTSTTPYIGIRCDTWENNLRLLIEETVDYWQLHLLYEETSQIALAVCADCLQCYIPRDSIFKIIEELRAALTPGVEYSDWCPNAPDLEEDDQYVPHHTAQHSSGYTAQGYGPMTANPDRFYPSHHELHSPDTAGISEVDSELCFNVDFDM
ncbi:hypothetical protein HD553DRAFT_348564 [Filobasidium floriforme]|uniref:uncharacterized protein n=1 Tax=Filobasidium floriforme TaxID=5210 RepID=UPI001E8CBC18|nr:uncharacterized protein HD553DRAFT_348564 [Filobasidium floriforme]KAH8088022.1 hypothetical protein HD553DRAFT_348564 [Filobasidium floriforme]